MTSYRKTNDATVPSTVMNGEKNVFQKITNNKLV
jgi:hypothetical protein